MVRSSNRTDTSRVEKGGRSVQVKAHDSTGFANMHVARVQGLSQILHRLARDQKNPATLPAQVVSAYGMNGQLYFLISPSFRPSLGTDSSPGGLDS